MSGQTRLIVIFPLAVASLAWIATTGGWIRCASASDPLSPGAGLVAQMPPQGVAALEIVVYGVIFVGQDHSAFLVEPQLTGGRVRRVVPGTILGPYRVSRIEVDGVVLEKDGVALRIPLGIGGRATGNQPQTLSTRRGGPSAGLAEDSGLARGPVAPGATETPAQEASAAKTAPPNAAAMWRLSQSLGLPLQTLEAQAAQTDLEPVDLLIAHRLALDTKLSLDEVVTEFKRRRAWGAIIQRFDVNDEKLNSEVREFLEATERNAVSRPGVSSR